jgi:perosamine synthetase
MTNIQAALGVAQLENVEEALQARQQLAGWYRESLDDLQEKIILPAEESWAQHVYWMFNILLRFGGESRRDSVMRHLGEDGIETRPTFYPMHVLPPYYSERAFPVADLWASRGINLPTHQLLTRQDVERVAGSLREALSVL